jgi:aryl-alcohol dehydrogenase-like predicted oxidoreductase
MKLRKLGDWDVSPLGMGCWAIGGPFWAGSDPLGWGDVDDNESIQAIHAGIECGINFIDTADVYGAGHSEKVIGQALKGKRDQIILGTKFGSTFDEVTKQCGEGNASADHIENAVENSLRRLQTDVIDLLWFHLNDYDASQADAVADTLETLVAKGKIKKFGWSTDFPDRAAVFAKYPNCVGFQFDFNVLKPNDMLSFCETHHYAGVNRGPLAMGLLSGKYHSANQLSENDIRRVTPDWMTYFKNGEPSPELTEKLNAIRDILTSQGRTLAQGSLAWIWGKSDITIPIPGFRTVKQITENARAMDFGPLTSEQVSEIDSLLK